MSAERDVRRSKHAGQPGSMTAIRVDYPRGSAAFEQLESTTNVAVAKQEALRWKFGNRLGDKPQWDDRCGNAWRKFPDRCAIRTLAEHQSTRMEPNYRAQTLPQCYRDTIFVPRVDKFKVSPALFLSQKDKAKVVTRDNGGNPGGALSRCEIEEPPDPFKLHTKQWNNSTEIAKDRANLHKDKVYDDLRAVNAAKHMANPSHYRNPMQTTSKALRAVRKVKERDRALRQQEEEEQTRPARVFKMSNRSEWQDSGILPALSMRFPASNVSADAAGVDGAEEPDGDGMDSPQDAPDDE